jgi:hypothetical protein
VRLQAVCQALRGVARTQSAGGAGSQPSLPVTHSPSPAPTVATAAWTSSPISATSRTAWPQATERGGAPAVSRRSRIARPATLATSDQLGRPKSAANSAASASSESLLSRKVATMSSSQASR